MAEIHPEHLVDGIAVPATCQAVFLFLCASFDLELAHFFILCADKQHVILGMAWHGLVCVLYKNLSDPTLSNGHLFTTR